MNRAEGFVPRPKKIRVRDHRKNRGDVRRHELLCKESLASVRAYYRGMDRDRAIREFHSRAAFNVRLGMDPERARLEARQTLVALGAKL